jgi:hypothetical protein
VCVSVTRIYHGSIEPSPSPSALKKKKSLTLLRFAAAAPNSEGSERLVRIRYSVFFSTMFAFANFSSSLSHFVFIRISSQGTRHPHWHHLSYCGTAGPEGLSLRAFMSDVNGPNLPFFFLVLKVDRFGDDDFVMDGWLDRDRIWNLKGGSRWVQIQI